MQRFEGKNLEEALNHAAQTFGVERYKLRHAVLTEKRGFFGGVKRVVIEAEVNENATEPPPQAVVAEARLSGPPRRERAPRGRSGGNRGGGSSRDARPARGGRGRRRRELDDSDDDRDSLQPGDFEQFAIEIPEQGPESETAAAVRGWCEQVLSLAKLNLAV